MSQSYNTVVILGPTASGKTTLGVEIAKKHHATILSADSRQVYRGMDIGTGKDLDEYGDIPYRLIDVVDPGEEYHLFQFMKDFKVYFEEVQANGNLPLVVGGSGLYLDAIVFGYRLREVPQDQILRAESIHMDLKDLQERLVQTGVNLHNKSDLHSRARLVRAIEIAESSGTENSAALEMPQVRPLIIGILWPPDQLRLRIATRLKQRLQAGLIDEAKRLFQDGLTLDKMEYYGLEYKFLAQYLKSELSLNDMTQKLQSAICQFAKRQRTWFRRMERKGAKIHWVDPKGDMVQQSLKIMADWTFLHSGEKDET